MEDVPRLTVVLAAASHPARERLLRLMAQRFSVAALRSDGEGTFDAVLHRRPDVLVCDQECGAEVLAHVEAGDPPPATWVVVLADDDAQGLPQGVTRIAEGASDRRLLSAVAAAGRFARTGVHTRVRHVPFGHDVTAQQDLLARRFDDLAREAEAG